MDEASASSTGAGNSAREGQAQRTGSAGSVGFGGIRRQSTSERINEILEMARERAERSSGSHSAATPQTPHESPTLSRNHSMATAPMAGLPEDEGPPDETTGIIMRGSDMNYRTTTSDGVRSRRSGQSGRESTGPSTEATQADGPTEGSTEGNTREGQPGTGSGRRDEKRWFEKMAEPFRSIELENKGSVARDHLAIERTFLAWLRTSLAFASIGIAVTQLFRLNTSIQDSSSSEEMETDPRFRTLRQLGKPLGATFLGISILMLFLGYHRYTESQQWVMKGKFPASRGTIMLVSFVTFAVTLASLVVVVVVHPREREL